MINKKQSIPFLRGSKNSHAREAILRHKFIFDVSVSAAKRNYYLTNYESDIDNEGVDIVLTDNDLMRPIQLKSIFIDSKATKWTLHKRLLRPTFYEIESLGLSPEPFSEGAGGAFILQCINGCNGTLDVEYKYIDIFTLLAFYYRVIKKKNFPSKSKTINDFYKQLFNGPGKERIDVPKSLLLTAKSPDHLLSLLSLHSPVTSGGGINHFVHQFTRFKQEVKNAEYENDLKARGQLIYDEINNITKEDLVFLLKTQLTHTSKKEAKLKEISK